jgi:hypothetical protein
MKELPVKKYPNLGCCGHDCGLCPLYSTDGKSKCPGCCGPGFSKKHPPCEFVTCCVKGKGLEVCAQCTEFPCARVKDSENILDSFASHTKTYSNLKLIKENGLEPFLEQQKKRIELLRKMTRDFDDGRSEAFFYVSANLLPLSGLESAVMNAEKQLKVDNIAAGDIESKALILKKFLNDVAEKEGIELQLGSKKA